MNYLIRDIPIDERPRERLIRHGVEALSNVELLALLLKTGNKGESALELSRKILYKFNNKRFIKYKRWRINDNWRYRDCESKYDSGSNWVV